MCVELPFLNPVSGFNEGKRHKGIRSVHETPVPDTAEDVKHIILSNFPSKLVRSVFLFPLHR